jgi:hypothetical protein
MIPAEKNPDATIIVAAEPKDTPPSGMRGTRWLRSVNHPPTAGRPEQHDLCAAAAEVGTGVISSYSSGAVLPPGWHAAR